MATFTEDQQTVIRGLQQTISKKGTTAEVLRMQTGLPRNVLDAVLRGLQREGVVEISPHKNFLGGPKWRLVQP